MFPDPTFEKSVFAQQAESETHLTQIQNLRRSELVCAGSVLVACNRAEGAEGIAETETKMMGIVGAIGTMNTLRRRMCSWFSLVVVSHHKHQNRES